MREFLVTKLYCSVCGGGLEVCHPNDEVAPIQRTNSAGAPSGAYVSELAVSVQPCRNCEWKHRQLQATVANLVQAAVSAGVDLLGATTGKETK